jgi:hypothetical protein
MGGWEGGGGYQRDKTSALSLIEIRPRRLSDLHVRPLFRVLSALPPPPLFPTPTPPSAPQSSCLALAAAPATLCGYAEPLWLQTWRAAAERPALDLRACPALQDGQTPLIVASSSGHSEVVGRLIAARAMVDAADKVLLRTRLRCHPHARTPVPPAASTTDERSTSAPRAHPL